MTVDIPPVALNNGIYMPGIGKGCWLGPDGGVNVVGEMCLNALKTGYRHLDTASGYNNEELVGKAIRDSGIPRSEIFLTTKIASVDHNHVRESFDRSFAKLNCEYIDLYLMHWPQARIGDRVIGEDESPTFVETWKEMEKLLDTGKVRSIGVSNFSIKNLEILLPHCKIVPATNQIELHPCHPSFELIKYCKDKGIVVTAYSPFGQGNPLFFADPDFAKIAEDHKVSPAQIAISWALQRGTVPIPKSVNPERMKANKTPVKLTPEEMSLIDGIHKKPGMHRSLMTYHTPAGTVFGWTYKQLGWSMTTGGYIVE